MKHDDKIDYFRLMQQQMDSARDQMLKLYYQDEMLNTNFAAQDDMKLDNVPRLRLSKETPYFCVGDNVVIVCMDNYSGILVHIGHRGIVDKINSDDKFIYVTLERHDGPIAFYKYRFALADKAGNPIEIPYEPNFS